MNVILAEDDLDIQLVDHREDDAELLPHQDRLFEQRLNLFRCGVCCHVKVFRFLPQEQIAYAPANQQRLESGCRQPMDHRRRSASLGALE